MTESTKIEFRHRRISEIADLTDLVAILFPGNGNQQHAAARILLAIKSAKVPLSSLCDLETGHAISRRTIQRARAKLARLGLIEHVTWMNSRYGGRTGWRLSGRMSAALRLLAGKVEGWREDQRPQRREKDEQLVELLDRPSLVFDAPS